MSTGIGATDPPPGCAAGRRTSVPQPAADIETIEIAGQSDVDDDQLGPLPVHQGQARPSLVSLQDAEPVPTQVHGHQVRYVVIILDDHHGVFSGHHEDQPATRGIRASATMRKV